MIRFLRWFAEASVHVGVYAACALIITLAAAGKL